MKNPIEFLWIVCPVTDGHGMKKATPAPAGGIRLECGCVLALDISEKTWRQGEQPDAAAAKKKSLMALLEKEPDVAKVHRLEQVSAGTPAAFNADRYGFIYLIETPFNYPKFCIGRIDEDFDKVRIEFRCGLLVSAENAWTRIMAGLPVLDDDTT